MWRRRYLDPDPELLREHANQKINPKFHALNSALVQLVRAAPRNWCPGPPPADPLPLVVPVAD